MKTDIIVGLGSCGIASGAQEVYDFFEKNIGTADIVLKKTSCIGICFQEPIVEVEDKGDLTDTQVKEVLKIATEYREKLLHQWEQFKQGKPIRIIKIKKTK